MLPAARDLPSGLKATTVTRPGLGSALSSLPVSASHTRTTLSAPAVASRLPSGLNATRSTDALSPVTGCLALPVSRSQTRTDAPVSGMMIPAGAPRLPAVTRAATRRLLHSAGNFPNFGAPQQSRLKGDFSRPPVP